MNLNDNIRFSYETLDKPKKKSKSKKSDANDEDEDNNVDLDAKTWTRPTERYISFFFTIIFSTVFLDYSTLILLVLNPFFKTFEN